MSATWETRFSRLVQRLAGLRESTALELLPDLMPVLPTIDAASTENLLPRGERLCRGWQTCANAAGNYSRVQLVNTTPGVIMVVRRIRVLAGVAGTYFRVVLAQSYGAGAAAGTLGFVDNRVAAYTTLPVAQIIPSQSAGTASGNCIDYLYVPALTAIEYPMSIVLTPDPSSSALIVETGTTNQSLTVMYEWTERDTLDEARRGG